MCRTGGKKPRKHWGSGGFSRPKKLSAAGSPKPLFSAGTVGCRRSLVKKFGNAAQEAVMAPPTKDHGPQIKNDETYQALRDKGASKEKAARIANAQAKTDNASSAKGGQHPAYEEWTRQDLYDKAKQIGIDGRSRMSKDQLIDALRNH
jgi:hypothetical protein